MTDSSTRRQFFHVEDANAMLPLVRAIAEDLSQLSREVMERRERLTVLRGHRQQARQDVYSEELAQVEQDLEQDSLKLQEYVEELRQLGVEPKNGILGLMDFPAWLDGREVYLCWQLGESEITHWHEIDAGFSGRQPLLPELFSTPPLTTAKDQH